MERSIYSAQCMVGPRYPLRLFSEVSRRTQGQCYSDLQTFIRMATAAAAAPADRASHLRVARLATCNLNQHALDFRGNEERIAQSIRAAKEQGARYRLGPELEIPGYGCQDHFLESDTVRHSWQVLARLLRDPDLTSGIVCDIGMPVIHRGVRYNCRIWCLDSRILFIRPKLYLANDGNYREHRYFTTWHRERPNETFHLPAVVSAATGQRDCPFGFFALQTNDCLMASEVCEELFTPDSVNVGLCLDGVDIVTNGSGSHHELRKLNRRVDLMCGATARSGGAYVYANQQGCDGGRLYFDGCSMVIVNGSVVAQASQFSVTDVEVVTADVDLESIQSYRGALCSRSIQAASRTEPIPRIFCDFNVCTRLVASMPLPDGPHYHKVEEEIALGPACWLWDYLRRSGACGFFLPLSGGADSASTCAIVGVMCQLVYESIVRDGNDHTLADLRRILGHTPEFRDHLQQQLAKEAEGAGAIAGRTLIARRLESINLDYVPSSAAEIAAMVLHTAYLGTSNSSDETRDRARRISLDIGCYHLDCDMDPMVGGVLDSYRSALQSQVLRAQTTGGADSVSPLQPEELMPRFKSEGGHWQEDLALQNIQARSRMVFSYLLAQLLPTPKSRCLTSFLLVLGSANVDEALRGYYTKYDCSAADLNPIGGVSKQDLRGFLLHTGRTYGWKSLVETAEAVPTAELRPEADAQTDEEDMGMTYGELGVYGIERKILRHGPYSMTRSLLRQWSHLSPQDVAEKSKFFFRQHFANRHKMTTLTPSYHAEQYSPDDNRYDLRPFLYPRQLTHQNEDIAGLVSQAEELARNPESKM